MSPPRPRGFWSERWRELRIAVRDTVIVVAQFQGQLLAFSTVIVGCGTTYWGTAKTPEHHGVEGRMKIHLHPVDFPASGESPPFFLGVLAVHLLFCGSRLRPARSR